jgi:hypothetical protein
MFSGTLVLKVKNATPSAKTHETFLLVLGDGAAGFVYGVYNFSLSKAQILSVKCEPRDKEGDKKSPLTRALEKRFCSQFPCFYALCLLLSSLGLVFWV